MHKIDFRGALMHGVILAVVMTLMAYVWGLLANVVMPPLSNEWDDIWRLQIWVILSGFVAYVACQYFHLV